MGGKRKASSGLDEDLDDDVGVSGQKKNGEGANSGTDDEVNATGSDGAWELRQLLNEEKGKY